MNMRSPSATSSNTKGGNNASPQDEIMEIHGQVHRQETIAVAFSQCAKKASGNEQYIRVAATSRYLVFKLISYGVTKNIEYMH
ncbi:hypothetical protein ACJ73_06494 [Blastomyces percursus]|uniref:Uncharacterized protein n=1 Tax=Blastomyces percursus TaxID=1658174 RepID=A0A1J9Q0W3_9EURO|nr:hypothetical protein ACJ73_06494 [Blastomyces percursus]